MTPLLLSAAAFLELIPQAVVIIIGFFITLWVLLKLAWSPIIKVIDERRDTITREFDSIEARQSELDSKIRDYNERLRQIDGEARDRLNKAVEEGRSNAAAILEEARQQTEELKKKAASDIQLEIEKARVEMRDQMVSITIQATEKLLRTELNDERRRDLVSSFITELENRKAS